MGVVRDLSGGNTTKVQTGINEMLSQVYERNRKGSTETHRLTLEDEEWKPTRIKPKAERVDGDATAISQTQKSGGVQR